MSDQPTVPVTAAYAPFDPKHRQDEVQKAIAEIEETGAKVASVLFRTPDGPPQYFLEFSAKAPHWAVRMQLENKHYDVGSKLGAVEVSFYAIKRIVESKGWAT